MKSKRAPFLFIAPAMILLTCFSLVPIILSLFISTTDMSLAGLADYSRINFLGLENYTKILADPVFRQAVFNTLYYVLIGVPLVVIFSLTVSILIKLGNNRLFSMMRLVFYAPSITNIVAISIVWVFLYNPNESIGLINSVIGKLGMSPIAWLQDAQFSKIALIILAVWRGIGLNMLIFSAALQGIPDNMYEAAGLDGASRWQQIWHITIPQLKFSLFFVVVTTVIGWLQFLEEPLVMTEGGPLNSSMSLSLFIYKNGFQLNNFGYAAAGSLLLFVVVIVITLAQMRLQNKGNEA